MILVGVIILGLLAGSFLTAFIDRLHDGRNFINARSTCDHCHKKLGFLDLIPLLSYLISKGHCRHCRRAIGRYYLLVEVATTMSFVIFYLVWPFELTGGDVWLFWAWLPVLTMLIALIIYDVRWMILPNKIIYPTMLMAIAIVFLRLILGHDLMWWDILLGILIGGGVFHLIFMVSDRYIGYGDVRLGFLLGMLLVSWQLSLLMIFLSSILALTLTLPLLGIKGRKVLETSFKIPFGPFLILATFITFSVGKSIIDWYLTLSS